jgi:hypothetical protein
MLDHGGPAHRVIKCPGKPGDSTGRQPGRFKELEGNIADVQAKLAEEVDFRETARLRVMLEKLEALLAVLEADSAGQE